VGRTAARKAAARRTPPRVPDRGSAVLVSAARAVSGSGGRSRYAGTAPWRRACWRSWGVGDRRTVYSSVPARIEGADSSGGW